MVHTSDIPDGAPGVVDFDMAAVQYPDDAVLTTENDQKVPNEILLKLVDYLDPKTMKCARLVCKAWKDFVSLCPPRPRSHQLIMLGYASSLSNRSLQS